MSDDTPDLDDLAGEYPDLATVLGSDALWDEPPLELEDRIVAAIGAEPIAPSAPAPTPPAPTARPRRWLAAVAAVVLVAGGFGLATVLQDDQSTPDLPEGELFALEGTELAGTAVGEIELTELRNGLRIVLDLEELPPAPAGTFYEAWMFRGTDQAVVSAGTFHMRNQTGSIVLWAGVTPADYPAFVITLEADDGDATPSQQVVFQADVAASTTDS